MGFVFRTLFSRRGVLGALLALLAAPVSAQNAGRVERITAEEAREKALSGELVMIDLRTPGELRESGVPDVAVTIDLTAKDFGRKLMEAVDGDRDKPVALICRTGGRSGYASKLLANNGFSHVYDVAEGTHGSGAGPGWLKRELPTRAPDAPAVLCCAGGGDSSGG